MTDMITPVRQSLTRNTAVNGTHPVQSTPQHPAKYAYDPYSTHTAKTQFANDPYSPHRGEAQTEFSPIPAQYPRGGQYDHYSSGHFLADQSEGVYGGGQNQARPNYGPPSGDVRPVPTPHDSSPSRVTYGAPNQYAGLSYQQHQQHAPPAPMWPNNAMTSPSVDPRGGLSYSHPGSPSVNHAMGMHTNPSNINQHSLPSHHNHHHHHHHHHNYSNPSSGVSSSTTSQGYLSHSANGPAAPHNVRPGLNAPTAGGGGRKSQAARGAPRDNRKPPSVSSGAHGMAVDAGYRGGMHASSLPESTRPPSVMAEPTPEPCQATPCPVTSPLPFHEDVGKTFTGTIRRYDTACRWGFFISGRREYFFQRRDRQYLGAYSPEIPVGATVEFVVQFNENGVTAEQCRKLRAGAWTLLKGPNGESYTDLATLEPASGSQVSGDSSGPAISHVTANHVDSNPSAEDDNDNCCPEENRENTPGNEKGGSVDAVPTLPPKAPTKAAKRQRHVRMVRRLLSRQRKSAEAALTAMQACSDVDESE